MSLLKLEKLTMRFGGLTAVDGVDCNVEPGAIQSIIGPNGAGKTTVFNAITGIYEPTSGAITFEGRDLRRPAGPRLWMACAAIGILTGLFAVMSVIGIDDLWVAAIKRNFAGRNAAFSYGDAWRSVTAYWRGDLGIQAASYGKWAVVSPAGPQLAIAKSKDEALRLRDQMQTEMERGENPKLTAIAEDAATIRRSSWLALFMGIGVGIAGTFAVWNRSRRSPDVITRAGIARTFQNIRLFKNMTVLENVLMAMDRKFKAGALRMAFHTPKVKKEERDAERKAAELLDFVGIRPSMNELAKNLPYGDQRRLEIARALASEPRLILLDEPAAGMNPSESADLTKLIEQIRKRGVTVLLIEHHMKLVMGISDRITVLDYGKKIAEGTPEEVRANPAVIKAYLGDEEVC
jgi:branched-chain amino acid transport system ATP-binding protein